MKYIIDVPEEIAKISEEFLSKAGLLCEPYIESNRKDIEDEMWEFLDLLSTGMSSEERLECFGVVFSHMIVSTMSYQEAKAKYEAWMKQKCEICVGDEVIYHRNKYIVGYVGEDEVYHLVDQCWLRVVVQGDYQLIKTGKHFNEMEELLKKMREKE